MNERTIFLTALEKENPAERSAYLDEACAGDAVLRQRVAALLRAHEEAGKFLDVPVVQQIATPGPPPPPAAATQAEHKLPLEPAPGAKVRYFGDYELLAEIGRGGMGVVYKARQTSLKRLVALKMILAGEYAGEQELTRFRTEAQAVARLQYPNIVQVYEIGAHESYPYFSLEFCAGGSLEKKLNGTPLPPMDAAALAETLARAMHAAHQAGIIHRDLKPANVLLTADGTPKITDFGLAKLVKEEGGQTRSGSIMGTPSYMAPEQAAGKNKEVGPAADIYALGAILYECLTGRPP